MHGFGRIGLGGGCGRLLLIGLGVLCWGGQLARAQGPAPSVWTAGVEAVFAQPRFTDNLALTQLDEDLSGNSRIRPLAFEYDFTPSQRLWLEYLSSGDVGIRASWWQIDAEADRIGANPPASGFGEVRHPELFDVYLNSFVPAERLTADSSFELYTIDLEVTKQAELANWDLLVSAGLRHAHIQQDYDLTLSNAVGVTAGQADLDQRLSGLGPTVAISSSRLAFDRLLLTAGVRASILLAESKRNLLATEDMDLPTPFATDFAEQVDDLLPIMETRFMGQWAAWRSDRGALLLSSGVEAQWWDGVGTASSSDSDLAFLNLTVGAGWMW